MKYLEKKYGIPKIICQNNKIKRNEYYNDIYYNNNILLSKPLIIKFIKIKNNEKISYKYEIGIEIFINNKAKELKFDNPVIISNHVEY